MTLPLKNAARPRKNVEAILSFDGACLQVEVPGLTMSIPAQGVWDGEVRIPAHWLAMLARMPPPGDPLRLTARDDRLNIGSLSMPCHVQAQWVSPIQMPLNFDPSMLLALKLRYSAAEIRAAGLEAAVADAENRCHRAVKKAAAVLAIYGVKPQDIRALVDQSFRESGLTAKL